MTTIQPPPITVLDTLVDSLEKAAVYNGDVQVAPAVVLWPDQTSQWATLLPLLRAVLPQLLTLGEYDPSARTGPATWIKCMLARTLPEAAWPEDVVPVLYMPGVAKTDLRAVESCPRHLQPLAELQYRGVFFTQKNGRDWSVFSYLKTSNGTGLGLDVAQDAKTQEAITRALGHLADTPVSKLRGRRLEASDFDSLLTDDPVRDILRWLNDPKAAKDKWSEQVWGAFRSVCKSDFGFDPQAEGELVGAEQLGKGENGWAAVWSRFAESPRLYPNLPALLRKAEGSFNPGLFTEKSSWPGANEKEEATLRAALQKLDGVASHEAAKSIKTLEQQHGQRRDWVWASLGMSSLANALGHLAVLADVASQALGGQTAVEMSTVYLQGAWRADASVWRALACVEQKEDVAAVTAAARSIYLPWVEAAAERLQEIVVKSGFPVKGEAARKSVKPAKAECIFFADGLRFDVGQTLREELEDSGLAVETSFKWQGLPSVTGTCKPAVSPIAHLLTGTVDDGNFVPSVAESGDSLATHRFRKLLDEVGVQFLGKEDIGDPKGKGWCEHGELDHVGHQEGAKLARRLPEQIRQMRERIAELLAAGWKTVRVVTDHGWLLMPGGLPKADLPNYLAETRWGRCAILKDSSAPTPLVVPWRWSADIRVALPQGIGSYKSNKEYTHGGLSLQECFTPELVVTSPGGAAGEVAITEVTWVGLRCRIEVDGECVDLKVDLRTKPAMADSSLAKGGKPLSDAGKASLVVEDNSAEGTIAVVVVINADGAVISKATTTVGGES